MNTAFTSVRSLRDAPCRLDLLRSFALQAHCVRPGQCGSQQHRPFCSTVLLPLDAPIESRPLRDKPSFSRGSTPGDSCEKLLCTLDKSLKHQCVCSTPFCTHELSGREASQERTCSDTRCIREFCSTRQSSSSQQLCNREPTREMHRFHDLRPIPEGRLQVWRRRGGRRHPRVAPLFSTQSATPHALVQSTREGQAVRHIEQTTWPEELSVVSGDDTPHVPQSSPHHDAVIRSRSQLPTNVQVTRCVLNSFIPKSSSYPAQGAVVHRGNNPKGVHRRWCDVHRKGVRRLNQRHVQRQLQRSRQGLRSQNAQ